MYKKLKKWWDRKKAEREEKLWPERKIIVKNDDETITVTYPEGKIEKAHWQELESIEVHTNDSGPWGADVWFVISSKVGNCTFPQGATGENEALDFMLQIKGFKTEEFIKSMGSTSNARFVCWEASKNF